MRLQYSSGDPDVCQFSLKNQNSANTETLSGTSDGNIPAKFNGWIRLVLMGSLNKTIYKVDISIVKYAFLASFLGSQNHCFGHTQYIAV